MRMFVVFAFLFSLLLLGCQKSPEQTVVGKWNGKLSSQSSDRMKEMFAMELKPDGTYTMKLLVVDFAGDWAIADGKLRLKHKTIEGMSVEEFQQKNETSPLKANQDWIKSESLFTISEDGKTLTFEGTTAETLVFTKTEG